MDWNEVATWMGAAIFIAALLLFPRWFSFRHRVIVGTILFPLGWAGIFTGLALSDRAFMRSEVVAWLWVGISAFAIVLAITLLVPVFFEWLRKRRRPKRRTGKWAGGHWKS
jgi:hypothetical protein